MPYYLLPIMTKMSGRLSPFRLSSLPTDVIKSVLGFSKGHCGLQPKSAAAELGGQLELLSDGNRGHTRGKGNIIILVIPPIPRESQRCRSSSIVMPVLGTQFLLDTEYRVHGMMGWRRGREKDSGTRRAVFSNREKRGKKKLEKG